MNQSCDGTATAGSVEPAPAFAANPVEQDWARLADHLAAHGMSLAPDPPPRQFASGLANLNYLVEIDGEARVLRRPPAGPLPPGAYDMRREHSVLSRLWRAFPLAPRALHLCEDDSVLGAPFFVMEYRAGRVIGTTMPADLAADPRAGETLSGHMLDAMTALHAVDPDEVGLDDLGRDPEGFLARQVAGWSKRARLAWDDALPGSIPETIAWLDTHVPPPAATALVHNDFKLDNFILESGGTAPVALLDWDMCTRADPLFDLAVLLSYWSEAGDPPALRDLGQMPTAGHGFPTRAGIAESYAARTGADLSHFRFHRALARLRLAVIFRQLYNLYERGATRDERYAGFASRADGLAEIALDTARGDDGDAP